jgi:hypothetical protein
MLACCGVTLALKAIMITFEFNAKAFEGGNPRKKSRCQSKIMDLSSEYKYNAFLRMGLELYLEISIVTLLSIKSISFGSVT